MLATRPRTPGTHLCLICKAGVTSALPWSVFSLLMCTGNSLMFDFGAFWNGKLQPLLGVNWISWGQALPLGCAGALGVPREPRWIFCLWCFGFSRWLWSESHPTDHCDPQTGGGHFWGESCPLLYGTVLHAFLVNDDSVFTFLCCFEMFARKISSFMTQDNNQKDFMACVRQVKYWHELSDPPGSAVWN